MSLLVISLCSKFCLKMQPEDIHQPTLSISNKIIGEGYPVFFIAEIGQNHQGDINIAKKLIDEAKVSTHLHIMNIQRFCTFFRLKK